MEINDLKNVGGTSGGLIEFVIGFVMTIAGGYMLISRVIVTSGFWNWGGYNTFGLSLVPLIFGIGFVFFNGRSAVGWILIVISIVIIASGILINLQIYFQPTSLFNTIIMLILFAGGIGLIARAVATHG
ncbi:MAG TPA: hypothetical protein VNA17_05490 [Pyrinomonadaceae bacterium]|nr:hypothetical protein [Pyrinomonadaceae bacterium]